MKRTTTIKRKLLTVFLSFILISVGLVVMFEGVLAQAQSSNTLIAYAVNGTPNWNNPGSESYWNNIPWTSFSLTGTVVGGGHTSSISVKAAHTSTQIYILLTWNDSHPSYALSSAFGGNGALLLFQNVTNKSKYLIEPATLDMEYIAYTNSMPGWTYVGLYANSTYYYTDRAAIMWSMGAVSDCMSVGPGNSSTPGGSLQSGPANIWEWLSGATDNSTNDAAWPLWQNESNTWISYKPTHSFAINLYTNRTGPYEVGLNGDAPMANWYPSAPGTVNTTYPFNVWVAAKYSNGNWTVEFVRNLTVSGMAQKYEVNLSIDQSYHVAFAVWKGNIPGPGYNYTGESAFAKSYTPEFITLTLSLSSPPTSSSISMDILYIITIVIALIIVGTAIMIAIYRRK